MNELPPSQRTTVKRLPQRGAYDAATIHAILDEGLVCHVSFLVEGQPCVIPTLYVRLGNQLYIHGSPASRMLRALEQGETASVAVTLIDGLVLARSAFHHSMNYRSVVLYGRPCVVEDPEQKSEILRGLSDHVIAGRWEDIRVPTEQELRRTMVIAIPIDEASAKIRTGPPIDDDADYALGMWAGVLPLQLVPGTPVPDPRLNEGIALPSYIANYRGAGSGDTNLTPATDKLASTQSEDRVRIIFPPGCTADQAMGIIDKTLEDFPFERE